MDKLLARLESIHPLPEALKERLQGVVQERHLTRKEYLLKEGKICQNVYFIEQGLLRCYYVKEGKEISSSFLKEGDICMSVESFYLQKYSNENIQALEDSLVYSIDHRELQHIYQEYPIFNFTGRVLTEQYYLRAEQQFTAMWMQKSHDRYAWLLENFPDLVRRVPAKLLASYLGITEVMLSNVKCRK
jgi:CRP/FNR family transcriptional regulator, anaerobic regulatory protein